MTTPPKEVVLTIIINKQLMLFIKTMGANYPWFFLFSYFCKPMPAYNLVHIVSFNVPYPADYGGVIDVFYKLKSLHSLRCKNLFALLYLWT